MPRVSHPLETRPRRRPTRRPAWPCRRLSPKNMRVTIPTVPRTPDPPERDAAEAVGSTPRRGGHGPPCLQDAARAVLAVWWCVLAVRSWRTASDVGAPVCRRFRHHAARGSDPAAPRCEQAGVHRGTPQVAPHDAVRVAPTAVWFTFPRTTRGEFVWLHSRLRSRSSRAPVRRAFRLLGPRRAGVCARIPSASRFQGTTEDRCPPRRPRQIGRAHV